MYNFMLFKKKLNNFQWVIYEMQSNIIQLISSYIIIHLMEKNYSNEITKMIKSLYIVYNIIYWV